jgi:hypothetical protein
MQPARQAVPCDDLAVARGSFGHVCHTGHGKQQMVKPVDARRANELQRTDAWVVTGVRDAVAFFRAVAALTPDATTMYLEGGELAPDVVGLLYGHADLTALHGVGRQLPDTFRLRFSRALVMGLADLAKRHRESEICDHLHIYRHDEPLLTWYDAFEGALLLSKAVSLQRLQRFGIQLKASWQ